MQHEESSVNHNKHTYITILINVINIAWDTTPAHCIFINIHTALPLQMVYHTQKNVIHHLTGFGKHLGYKVPGKYSLYFCE